MEAIYENCAYEALDHHLFKNLEPFAYWHVCESVQEGYTPEAVGCFQETAEIEAWILEQRTNVRNHALGLFISRLRLYLASDDEFATAIAKCEEQLSSKAPDFDAYILNTTRIYEYIEEEKKNCGLLDGYPDWHWIEGVQTITQWTYEFRTALDLTRAAYTDACKRLQPVFEKEAKADFALVKIVPPTDLVQLLNRFAVAPKRVPKPLRSKGENAWDEAKVLLSGQLMRTASLDLASLSKVEPDSPNHDILLQAANAESNPSILVTRAERDLRDDTREEALLRSAKQKLTSALHILAERDGSRNIDLRIVALNNRAAINFKLASYKKSTLKYYLRAISDWKASLDLDQLQEAIAKQVESTEELVKELDDKPPSPVEEPTESKTEATTNGKSTKPREKTILESPFFRADLVSGLMVDALLSLRFPHRALRDTLRLPITKLAETNEISEVLTSLADKHQLTTQTLSVDNRAQLREAAQAIAAVLALPMYQTLNHDDAAAVLKVTSLRLVLGSLSFLQNDYVKAQTELDLVSNALRPKSRPAVTDDDVLDLQAMQSIVQGHTLLLLAQTCSLQHKTQEAVKYFRWFIKWCAEASAKDSDGKVPELDMRWWDLFVVKKIDA